VVIKAKNVRILDTKKVEDGLDVQYSGRVEFELSNGKTAVSTEASCDLTWANSGCIFSKNAANDLSLGRVDLAISANRLAISIDVFQDFVAIARPADSLPSENSALHTSTDFEGEIFQEKSIHGALQANMKLVNFTLFDGE
jgi:hypothetical protein